MKCFVWRRIWQVELEHITLILYVVATCMLRIIILSTTWTTQRQNKACPLERHEVCRWKISDNFPCLDFGFYKNWVGVYKRSTSRGKQKTWKKLSANSIAMAYVKHHGT